MRRIAVVVALVAGLALANPAPAFASCSWWWCTSVGNSWSSGASILVASQWQAGTYNSSAKATVRPGATSKSYLRDVNAVWVPSGCTASSRYGTFYGGRWSGVARGIAYLLVVRC